MATAAAEPRPATAVVRHTSIANDPAGNQPRQIINEEPPYLYDAANRLTSVYRVEYTSDNNGNLLATGLLTNTFDAK